MELYRQDIAFLKLRTQILYATSAAVDVVKSTDGTRNKCLEELKTILNDWKNLYTKITEDNHVPIRQVSCFTIQRHLRTMNGSCGDTSGTNELP